MDELKRGALKALDGLLSSATADLPAATASRGATDLTVAFATYDDFDGAFFTLHSLLLHHPEVLDRTEILILDNQPEGLGASALAAYPSRMRRNVRYVPYADVRSTAVRDVIFHEAAGRVVVVLDSHVLLGAGALRAVLDHFDAHPDSLDLVQGPMLSGDATHLAATHMSDQWRGGMWGVWAVDERAEDPAAEPFDIPSQGLAAFACRRDAWPGINPDFRGFGGEEGYLHEKFRQRGGRTLCLPAFRWVHRFDRPRGVSYPIRWVDRVHNYLVGWAEIGYDLASVAEHFSETLQPREFLDVFHAAERAVQAPARFFGGTCITSDELRVAPWRAVLGEAQEADLDVTRVVVPLRTSPSTGHDAQPAADRLVGGLPGAVRVARRRRWRSVLVVDESSVLDAALHYRAIAAVQVAAPGVVVVVDDAGEPGAVVVYETHFDQVLAGEASPTGPVPAALATATVRTRRPVAPRRDDRASGPPQLPVAQGVVLTLVGDADRADRALAHLSGLGVPARLHPALDDPARPASGRARSWRRALGSLAEAAATAMAPGTAPDTWVLLAHDDLVLLDASAEVLDVALREALDLTVDVLVLGSEAKDPGDVVPGTFHLRRRTEGSADVAVLVRSTGLARLCEAVPDDRADPDGFETWLRRHGSVAGFLDSLCAEGTGAALWPGVVSTRELLRAGTADSVRARRFVTTPTSSPPTPGGTA